MAQIKTDDFIEVEYTGKLKAEGMVFDTTSKEVAEKNDMLSPKMKYGPIVVCVGKGQLVSGLDSKIIGKDIGTYNFDLIPEEAFGKKDAKLIQMVPTRKFVEQKVQPMPGLQINVDGAVGVIKTVSGGRTLVDFNHPLSGKEVSYEIKINRIVTDLKEKVEAMLLLQFNMTDASVTVKENKATITVKTSLPPQVTEMIAKAIGESTKADIEFAKKEDTAKPVPPKETANKV